MRRTAFSILFCITLLSWGCQRQQSNEEANNKTSESGITKTTEKIDSNKSEDTEKPIADTEHDKPVSLEYDITHPDKAVEAFIAYAKANDIEKMKSLCDPATKEVSKDRKAKNICAMLEAGNAGDNIKKMATAKINGDINIKGEFASVPISYLNDKPDHKDMVRLSLRGTKWYISNIEPLQLNKE